MSRGITKLIPFCLAIWFITVSCPAWAWRGRVVEVHRMDTDRCGRTLALVAVDKSLLNE